MEILKILIIGLGSMGKRRVRNLKHLNVGKIYGFDVSESRRKEAEEKYGIKTFKTFETAIKNTDPDVFIISTPPNNHLEYELEAAKRKIPFFCEASIVSEGMKNLLAITKKNNVFAAPSCTILFHPGVKKIKEIIGSGIIGKPISLMYHSGQYLPDWHPWEDYRKYYVSQRETGGAREIVSFELTWLVNLFGNVKKIGAIVDKLTDLEADIDDTYHIVFKTEKGVVGSLQVDVTSRHYFRDFKLIGTKGNILWSALENEVKTYSTTTRSWSVYEYTEGSKEESYISGEGMYVDEMRCFFNALYGKEKFPNTIEKDMKNLQTMETSEKSSREQKFINL